MFRSLRCCAVVFLSALSFLSAQPVTTHPRLWVTKQDLPRLRQWATNSNPMYAGSLKSTIADAVETYNTMFFPAALSAALPLKNLDTAAVPNSEWPDKGTNDTEGYPCEAYAELFAFASLVEPDPAVRLEHARRARNMMMYGIREAIKGIDDDKPYRWSTFVTYNRGNFWGEGWGLTMDWLQASDTPVLSAHDKKQIREVFLMWAGILLNASSSGDEHPQPVGLINSPQLLQDTLQLRMALNNYYTGHQRVLALTAMSIDSADDPQDQPTVLSGVAYPSLRSYVKNVTGAWLYQQYAAYENGDLVASQYGMANNGLGFATGGMSVEGFMYGTSLGSLVQTLLALHTAGYADPKISGPQAGLLTSSYWDKFVEGFLHSIATEPTTVPDAGWLGNVHLFATYGDVLRAYVTYYDWTDIFVTLSIYDAAVKNTARRDRSLWVVSNLVQGEEVHQRYNGSAIWGNGLASTAILTFLAFDPVLNTAALPDPRPALGTDFVSTPMMRLLSRTDWTADQRWFTFKNGGAHINHQNGDAGGFEFYRKGEWMVKQRAGYTLSSPDYLNTLGIQNTVSTGDTAPANLSWFLTEVWNRGGQPNNGYNAGDPTGMMSLAKTHDYMFADLTPMYNWPHQWDPSQNATDVEHASRSILWLKPDIIVTYDRERTKHADRFKRTHLCITGSAAINGHTAAVTTEKGQKFYVQSLLPSSSRIATMPVETQDELVAYSAIVAEGDPSTLRMTIDDTLRPAQTRFLTVLNGADGLGTAVPAAVVKSSAGTAFEGVVLSAQNAAVLFPYDPGAAFTGTTFSVPSSILTWYVAGLKPMTGYSAAVVKNGANATVTIAPGGPVMADSAGLLVVNASALGVNEHASALPAAFALEQNYPNPFNPSTTIAYAVPVPAEVTLTVTDLLGRTVATLVNERQSAGKYAVRFDASGCASGVYFYTLTAGSYTATKKFTVMK